VTVTSITVVPEGAAALPVRATVDSLRVQTHEELEILLVLDGADPDALPVMDDPRVRVLALGPDGRAGALNAGLAAATGSQITLLDPGDVRPPWGIAALLAASREAGADIAIGRSLRLPGARPPVPQPGAAAFDELAAWPPETGVLEPGTPHFARRLGLLAAAASDPGAMIIAAAFLRATPLVFANGLTAPDRLFLLLALARAERIAPCFAHCHTRVAGPQPAAAADPFDALGGLRLGLELLAREPRIRAGEFRSGALASLLEPLHALAQRVPWTLRRDWQGLAAALAREAPPLVAETEGDTPALRWFRHLRGDEP
jgi:hypothetical protein